MYSVQCHLHNYGNIHALSNDVSNCKHERTIMDHMDSKIDVTLSPFDVCFELVNTQSERSTSNSRQLILSYT